jgi:hypothetical protein
LALDADNKILSGPSDQLVWRIIPPTSRPGFHSFFVVKILKIKKLRVSRKGWLSHLGLRGKEKNPLKSAKSIVALRLHHFYNIHL